MNHYVYLHKTNDGEVFYVGKGLGKRAFNLAARSNYHKRISKKYGCNVHILRNGLTEDQANDLEKSLILEYKKLGLCRANFTLGGEGRSGLKHSDETRLKMSRSQFGHPGYTKGMKMSKESSMKKSNFMKNSMTNCKQIKCLNDGCVYNSLADAVAILGLSGTSNLSKVLKGTRTHINGLRFEYV